MILLQRKPNPLWSYCLPLEGKAPLCSSFSKTSFPSTFSNPPFTPEMMGESTFEFSVNEYSWQPKVTFWPFQLLSTSLVDPSFLQGPTVPAPEELEPHLWMLHGKQQFNNKSIQWWDFSEFCSQGGRTVRYAIYVNGQEVENGTEPSTGGSIQGLPAGILF